VKLRGNGREGITVFLAVTILMLFGCFPGKNKSLMGN
jgi:hypothetical protein